MPFDDDDFLTPKAKPKKAKKPKKPRLIDYGQKPAVPEYNLKLVIEKFLQNSDLSPEAIRKELKLIRKDIDNQNTAFRAARDKLIDKHEELDTLLQNAEDPDLIASLKVSVKALEDAIKDQYKSFSNQSRAMETAESQIAGLLQAADRAKSAVTPDMKEFFQHNLKELGSIVSIEERIRNYDNVLVELSEELAGLVDSKADQEQIEKLRVEIAQRTKRRDQARKRFDGKIKPFREKQTLQEYTQLIKTMQTGSKQDLADNMASVAKKAIGVLEEKLADIVGAIPNNSRIRSDIVVSLNKISTAAQNMRKLAQPFQSNDVARTAILSGPALYSKVADNLIVMLQRQKTGAPLFDRIRNLLKKPNPVADQRKEREEREKPRTGLLTDAQSTAKNIVDRLYMVFQNIPKDKKLKYNITNAVSTINKETKRLEQISRRYDDDYPNLRYSLSAIAVLLNSISTAITDGIR